jgi:hypothetical protein
LPNWTTPLPAKIAVRKECWQKKRSSKYHGDSFGSRSYLQLFCFWHYGIAFIGLGALI